MKPKDKQTSFNEPLAKTLEYAASQTHDKADEERLLKTAKDYRLSEMKSETNLKKEPSHDKPTKDLSEKEKRQQRGDQLTQALVDNLKKNLANNVPTN